MEYMSISENKSNESSKYYDSADLANGSYGAPIDKYIGKSPIDGPDGYVFRKITYLNQAASADAVTGTFQAGPLARGTTSMLNGTTRSVSTINNDQLSGGGISGDEKLVPGDIILAAILNVIDGRPDDKRSGQIAGGIVPTSAISVNSGNVHYGVFPAAAGGDQSTIVSTAIGGGKAVAAHSVKSFSVCNRSFDTLSPYRFENTVADVAMFAAPVHAVAITGISTAADAANIYHRLTIYALCGARPAGLSHPEFPDPDFTLSCLNKKVAEHTVNML
uniref:Uncharacterized protein n=1 Tax=viral metagenome TaxID=1070528 RepID=A0A2V0RBM5_9ZZZZ